MLNGSDQNAVPATLTAQASIITAITAQAASGASSPRSSPRPPMTSAPDSM